MKKNKIYYTIAEKANDHGNEGRYARYCGKGKKATVDYSRGEGYEAYYGSDQGDII